MNTPDGTASGVPPISRILVATDFSAQARNALEWARRLGRVFAAELVLLHVIDIFSLAEIGPMMAGNDPLHLFREQAHTEIAKLKATVPDAEAVVREASPRPTIVDAALE